MSRAVERKYEVAQCHLLAQIGALQQRVAQLELEKLQREEMEEQNAAAQKLHDQAVDRRDMPSGAPLQREDSP